MPRARRSIRSRTMIDGVHAVLFSRDAEAMKVIGRGGLSAGRYLLMPGAIIALLLAPKPGTEVRSAIADATRRGIGRSQESTQRLRDKAGEYSGSARDYERHGTTAGAAGGTPARPSSGAFARGRRGFSG